MKKICFLSLLIFTILLIVSGCTRIEKSDEAGGSVPVLDIYLTNGYPYAPVRVLEDDAARAELEEALGITLRLNYRDQHQDVSLLSSGSVNGVILSDDPVSIQTLADHAMISQLDAFAIKQNDSSYGRYLGVQYGYVFTNGKHMIHPLLLVSVDKLEAAGARGIPYTEEGWRELLQKLHAVCSEPLAVYGSPVDPSYVPLLALFGLTPQGGHEFRFGPEMNEYDKLSDSGQHYLQFLNDLYREELLPKDMLSMNIYSAGYKMLKNVSAMTVMYDEAYIRSFLESAEASGLRIAAAELPLSNALLETGTKDRFFGMITANCAEKELAGRFLTELEKMSLSIGAAEDPVIPEAYPLFVSDPSGDAETEDDPHDAEINILYESLKNKLDAEFLIPYYSQIAVGEKGSASFGVMCTLWRESSVTMMNSTFEGSSILEFYQR